MMKQCAGQRGNLLSGIRSLASVAWQIGTGRNQSRACRSARRVNLATRPHLGGKPGDGALTPINAMILLDGKVIPPEHNVTADLLPDRTRLVGRSGVAAGLRQPPRSRLSASPVLLHNT
jgi:hypothetical protein